MWYIPDHPIIRNLEATGYPDGQDPPVKICPKCGEEAFSFYINFEKEIVGCDNCINVFDAWDVTNCDDSEDWE